MKTILVSLTMAGMGVASAGVAPIGPDVVSAAPRAYIDSSLVASPAMNRIDPVDVIPFDPDSTVLTDDTKIQIDAAARWLLRHPSHRIVLEGHADRSGSDLYNEDLANRRISAVRNRLLLRGIASDRVATSSAAASALWSALAGSGDTDGAPDSVRSPSGCTARS
jgi:outer membrane protein OmpA-like peptidoglycan-associated protein